MERRQAVALAATGSAIFVLGAAALTANAAILGGDGNNGVGTISPVVAVDPGAGSSGAGTPADAAQTTTTPGTDPALAPGSIPGGGSTASSAASCLPSPARARASRSGTAGRK